MDKKIAGLLGTVAAVGMLTAAQAAPLPNPSDALKANSYADLLEPVQNAPKILQALDEQGPAASADTNIQPVGWYHHHHHHHHAQFGFVPAPFGFYRHHHHHHHHHHHGYYFRRF